jgi:CheY-like chemotaxis protein
MENAIKQTVLIIDNDRDEVMITRMALSKAAPQIEVAAAFSGEAGLAILRGGTPLPLLILLDLKMPGLDGIEVLQQIRSDDRLKHLPVIIVTNSTLASDRQKSIEAGASCYLHKAFDIDQHIRDVKAVLDQYYPNPK